MVNDEDEQIGVMEKMKAHETATLHRAFSVFIFNNAGEMLLQQRAFTKYHSAGLWTNACCSHPRPGEETLAAAKRRLSEELGFETELQKVFDFTYKSGFSNGLTEYEFDHVFVGGYNGIIYPDPIEVSNHIYKAIGEIEESLQLNPNIYTTWFHIAFPKIKEWWQTNFDNKQP
jgi:isopentenyl-diphosphate delta-isomerase